MSEGAVINVAVSEEKDRSGPEGIVMDNVAAQLTGIWRNELASELHLEADPAGGLAGSFRSGVGERHDRCPLTGSYVTSPSGRQAVRGFAS